MFVEMMLLVMVMVVAMIVIVFMRMRMIVMVMVMMLFQMNVKLDAFDPGLMPAPDVQVVSVQLQLLQLTFQFPGVHAEVEQRGDEHVTGDAAEDVEVKNFHDCETSALICDAA